jgi:hypothetical protein
MSLILLWPVFPFAVAEIKPDESTDDTGLNKKERIDAIESYLANMGTFTASIKNMETKLEESSKKLKALEETMKTIRGGQVSEVGALSDKKVTPPVPSKEAAEIEKLKADILALKNQDIEKMKIDFQELREAVKALQEANKTKIR